MIQEEIVFCEKCFRSGTIFTIVGWREVKGRPYIILSKGSWEGLIDYQKHSSSLIDLAQQ